MRSWLFLMASLLVGCVGPSDTPSKVHDLRVLGVRLEPPEIMGPSCDGGIQANFALFPAPVTLTALIADPAGKGRALTYELRACASTDDGTCSRPGESTRLAFGTDAHDGELVLTTRPALTQVGDGGFLIQSVLAEDPFKGLGGVRMPLVLHVYAGTEEVFAQKLMVFSCKLFPGQIANENPVLPGITLPDGSAWLEGTPPTFTGPGAVALKTPDLAPYEVPYLVPSIQLLPVHLQESWRLAWYADHGAFSPESTGGVNGGGAVSANVTAWTPSSSDAAGSVRYWFVVRDGRGGMSWLARSAHFAPASKP